MRGRRPTPRRSARRWWWSLAGVGHAERPPRADGRTPAHARSVRASAVAVARRRRSRPPTSRHPAAAPTCRALIRSPSAATRASSSTVTAAQIEDLPTESHRGHSERRQGVHDVVRRQGFGAPRLRGGLVEHLPQQILDVVVGRCDRAAVGQPAAVIGRVVVVHQPGRQGEAAVLQDHLHVAGPARRHGRPQPDVDEVGARCGRSGCSDSATAPRNVFKITAAGTISVFCTGWFPGYGRLLRSRRVCHMRGRDSSGHVHPAAEQGVTVDVVHTATAGRRCRRAPEAPMLPLRDGQVVGPGRGCARCRGRRARRGSTASPPRWPPTATPGGRGEAPERPRARRSPRGSTSRRSNARPPGARTPPETADGRPRRRPSPPPRSAPDHADWPPSSSGRVVRSSADRPMPLYTKEFRRAEVAAVRR